MKLNLFDVQNFDTLAYFQKQYQQKYITHKEFIRKQKEFHYLVASCVLRYNHHQSTSISQKKYKQITKTIHFAIAHALQTTSNYTKLLYTSTFQDLFQNGIQILEHKKMILQDLYTSALTFSLPFENERYRSILEQQIPTYLSSLSTYEGFLYYRYLKEDLDYPLIDGLPLFQNMYDMIGIDIAIEYMQRFLCEQELCAYFIKELPEFISTLENHHHVEVDLLGINLCEAILPQVLGNIMLQKKPSLFLTQHDLHELSMMVQKSLDISSFLTSCNCVLSTLFPATIVTYLKKYDSTFLENLKKFQSNISYVYFIPSECKNNRYHLQLQANSKITFSSFLNTLESLENIEDKIQYLHAQHPDVYDVIDVFEQSYFNTTEYAAIFASFPLFETSILFRLAHEELFVFHTSFDLLDYITSSNNEEVWIQAFNDYIKTLPLQTIRHLEKMIHEINIRV